MFKLISTSQESRDGDEGSYAEPRPGLHVYIQVWFFFFLPEYEEGTGSEEFLVYFPSEYSQHSLCEGFYLFFLERSVLYCLVLSGLQACRVSLMKCESVETGAVSGFRWLVVVFFSCYNIGTNYSVGD